MAVASSSDCWSAAKNTVDVLVAFLSCLVNVGTNISGVCFRVEGAHSSDKSAHHCHGVSIVSESFDKRLKTLMVVRVGHNFLVKDLKLLLSGELTVDN